MNPFFQELSDWVSFWNPLNWGTPKQLGSKAGESPAKPKPRPSVVVVAPPRAARQSDAYVRTYRDRKGRARNLVVKDVRTKDYWGAYGK